MEATIKPLHNEFFNYDLSCDGLSPTQWITPGKYRTLQELFAVGFEGMLGVNYQEEILRLLLLNIPIKIPLEGALTL